MWNKFNLWLDRILEVRPSDPLLTNRWGNLAFGMIWLLDGIWGFVSATFRIPTLSLSTPHWYEVLWSTGMTIAGLTAAFGCLSVFFRTPWLSLLNKKRVELYGLYWLTGFVGIYIILLFYFGWIADPHDPGRASLSIVAIQFAIMPLLRIYQLNRRISAIISTRSRLE
jgi:hypothetical protein